METRPFPHNTNYLVREDGAIRRITGKWLSPQTMKRGGYLAVGLWTANKCKLWPVHQVVAFTFLGDRPSLIHQAAHHDGDKRNCHVSNIRWKTKAENEADKIRHGTSNRGIRNGMCKLTETQILKIRSDGRVQRIIGEDYGIHQSTVVGYFEKLHNVHNLELNMSAQCAALANHGFIRKTDR